MKKIIIFGVGEIAELANYYFENDTPYEIAAFTVDKPYISSATFCSKDVVAFEDLHNLFPPEDYDAFIAISYKKMNKLRTEKFEAFKKLGYTLVSYISPFAFVAKNVSIGENCFILEDNTIQPFVSIGDNVTLWSGNHIGHHSHIRSNCFITSHVVVSGGVDVSENSFIGVNATLFNHIKIGKYTFIGGHSLIQKDTESYSVYYGNRQKPANRNSLDINI